MQVTLNNETLRRRTQLEKIVTLILIQIIASAASAEISATKTGDSVVDSQALTIVGGFGQAINGLSFQQDAVLTYGEYQYVGYYDGNRQVCLARRKCPEGPWQIIRFKDYNFKSNDAHNTISIGICPKDGTIHISFDHHGHPLHYRVSQKNAANDPESADWNASLFGPIKSEIEKGKPIRITYPRFWQTPDGGLQFCYRQGGSGNGDRMLVDYNSETGTWGNTRQIDSRKGRYTDHIGTSRSRCSYPNGYTYGPSGNLHATWVWREHSQGANHDLVYVYSEDCGRTWFNNDGVKLNELPNVNSPDITVVKLDRRYGLMNTHSQEVDSQGRMHVVLYHCTDQSLKDVGSKPGEQRWGPENARRYLHYWRDKKGKWHSRQLPGIAGHRPKIFADLKDNLYVIYSTSSQGTISSDLVIQAASAKSKWTDWQVIHTEKGPFVNEMLGDYYRWKKQGVLSVMVQESPTEKHESTSLRILDFTFKMKK